MITEAIVDSCVFIGNFDKKDQYLKYASNIFKAFENRQIKRIYLTDYVALETLNFILKKVSQEDAESTMDYIFETENVNVLFIDGAAQDRIREIFKKHKGLSWTDCSLIYLSEKTGIRTLFSFDSMFDRVKGLERLESAN